MQANKKGRPGGTGAAKQTNAKHPTTRPAKGATIRKPLTPDRRGPFWQSVGEAIERAARAAGRAS